MSRVKRKPTRREKIFTNHNVNEVFNIQSIWKTPKTQQLENNLVQKMHKELADMLIIYE